MPAKETRPVITVKKKPIDIFFEIASLILLLLMWAYAFYYFQQLPNTIPIHFGFDGKPDGFGSKAFLLLTPGIVTIIIILLRWLNHFPHKFNYLATINEKNAEAQYRMATRFLRYLQFMLSCLFSYIVFSEIKSAQVKEAGLDIWFMFLIIPTITIPAVYTVYNSLRK